MIRWGYLTLVDRDDRPFEREKKVSKHPRHQLGDIKRLVLFTNERRPTPKPLMTRPRIMDQNPTVSVCKAPPIVNTTAPTNRVPCRPIISPTRPAASDVAIEREKRKGERTRSAADRITASSTQLNAPISRTATIVPT